MFNRAITLMMVLFCISCAEQKKEFKMGSYGYDKEFLLKSNIDALELVSQDGESRVLISPQYQGRVMTSSSAGDGGDSYGWINHKFISKGEFNNQFNPVGGEERFWLGPEGGPYSLYFEEGKEQVYENWIVPSIIDTDGFKVVSKSDDKVTFATTTELTNASGTTFKIGIDREISMLDKSDIKSIFNLDLDSSINMVGYKTDNAITNNGEQAWSKDSGLVSIWLLGMFNPTETTTVFIPYKEDGEGVIVNDEYFGKVPSDRLITEGGFIFFKIDGKCRSKIGIPKTRATELCGSYDSAKGVLTFLMCDVTKGDEPYLNGQWGEQDDPYAGDVINSYNDGPTEDGTIAGPFYEIESSSCAKELAAGETLSHRQYTVHLQGDKEKISAITSKMFGISIDEITSKFSAK